jgi:hypothetical protein
MIIDPKEIQELEGLILDFSMRKEWTIHCLLESLATIEFVIRLNMQQDVREGPSLDSRYEEGLGYDPQDPN